MYFLALGVHRSSFLRLKPDAKCRTSVEVGIVFKIYLYTRYLIYIVVRALGLAAALGIVYARTSKGILHTSKI